MTEFETEPAPQLQPQSDYRGPGGGKAIATMAPKRPSWRGEPEPKRGRGLFGWLLFLGAAAGAVWYFFG